MVSAATDAVSYLGLGHVFPANMTGNTVLLGIGLATGDHGAAARSATALGAFLLGAAAGGAAVPGRVSRRMFLVVVAVEAGLLGGMGGWWLALGTPTPQGRVRYALILLAGLTMGAQSALVRSLAVPVSTTYITGTWTALSAGVASRLRPSARDPAEHSRPRVLQLMVVLAYLGTAAGAALAYSALGAGALAAPVGVLLVVLAVAVASPDAAEDS